ncbi:Putative_replication factor-a protein [Hexamita inflata]|uniref:Replication factor-a protein n=1 Tax=Hexamita inflata TaxID=28002 RepID=A0AA86QEW6_9EUKA|nr:Putative replication factor-a protein [Hexamita inflata]
MTTCKICDLNDFGDYKFSGRVTNKRQLGQTKTNKPWFSFVVDDGTCDIKISVFQGADKFFPLFNEGDCVRVERASFQSKSESSKKFDKSKSQYEANLKESSIIVKLDAQEVSIKHIAADYQELLTQLKSNSTDNNTVAADVIFYSTNSVNYKQSADGADKAWKNVSVDVFDKSGSHLRLTFWERDLQNLKVEDPQNNLDFFKGKVFGITKCVIKSQEKYGESAACTSSSRVFIDQDVVSNFTNGREHVEFTKNPVYQTFMTQQKQAMAGSPQQTTKFGQKGLLGTLKNGDQVRALVHLYIDPNVERATYQGCSKCKKKECLCGVEQRAYYKPSAIMSDSSTTERATLFDTQAELVLGMPANEFTQLDPAQQQKVLTQYRQSEVVLKYVPAQGEQREQSRIQSISDDKQVDWKEWIEHKLNQLGVMEGVAMK